MVFVTHASPLSSLSNAVHCFLNGRKVLKLEDFVLIKEETIAYVIGCFYGVAQGIDFMVHDQSKPNPRYYLEIKVGDELNELDFVLFDDVVKKFAPLTSIALEKKNGCFTIYPNELEKMLGDPILFKVRKDFDCDSCGAISVEVLDFLIDSNLMEIYLNPAHIVYQLNEISDETLKPYNVHSESSTDDIIGVEIPQVMFPAIKSSIDSNCPILDKFIGNCEVQRLSQLSFSEDGSPIVVIGWYESVSEGIDIWYPDDKNSEKPRFRLKINVRDNGAETVFALFDDQVKNIALDTCAVLISIGESASMYPNELDILYGDAILLKVSNKNLDTLVDSKGYEVVEMLTDPFILDKFFQCYIPSYGAFDCVGPKSSPIEIYDAFSSTESENFIEADSPYFKRKTHAEIIPGYASSSSKRLRNL